MLLDYNEVTYAVKKDKNDSTIWLVNGEKENIKVNAPMQCTPRNKIVVDTVNHPYIDVSLMEAGVSLKRVGKALKGKEEYPVHLLTNEFMQYVGIWIKASMCK